MSAPFILIDASSYFYRAFHALPPLTNSKGQPTGAIYGVVNMIKKLIKDYQPTQLAVVFDAKGKTFRDALYPAYKAHRPATPPELASQFTPLLQLLESMGLPLLVVEGVEADDVIGTLAVQASAQGKSVLISTGDKDMAQLVSPQVTLINTMTNSILDPDAVRMKFGVHPEQMIDFLTLTGDSADNIPGVHKCGPKTAAKWLNEYQTIDELISHAQQITGKIGEYLRDSLAQLPLSKQLVTIKKDVVLPVAIDDLVLKAPQKESLLALVQALEFKNWLKELLLEPVDAPLVAAEVSAVADYQLITTKEQLTEWLQQLNSQKELVINTKASTLDAMNAQLVGFALALPDAKPVYIPLAHSKTSGALDIETALALLKPFLEQSTMRKIGHNMKYDYCILKKYGIHLHGPMLDVMLQSYVVNSNASRHDKESLAVKYLGYTLMSYEEIAGKGSKQVTFDKLPVSVAALYATAEVSVIWRLQQQLTTLLDKGLDEVFQTIEMPLVAVLAEMERLGVLIDPQVLAQHGQRLKERMMTLEQEAIHLAGRAFNLNSPKQLQEILFDEQQLPVVAKTPKGQPSTAESVLQELSADFRLPAVILEYRSLSKLVSTYIDALPQKINAQTGRIHTSFNQAITATGRLSSSDPNLQNIPVKTEEGRLIRKAFIAPPGYVLLAADYSQIELRIMAHLSEDANLLAAFANGWDIHRATASEIFDVPLDAVSAEQRRRAKAVNFGLIYGMSSFGLAKQLGIERQDAQYYIDKYFQRYPGVLHYMENTRQKAHELGYVETLFGRRLYLPEINARNIMRQKAAERMAINAPMQGTAADIIKKSMLALAQWQEQQEEPKARMIMQVHDELVFEVPETQVKEVQQVIQYLMEHTVCLSIPLLVSIGIGRNWDEAH